MDISISERDITPARPEGEIPTPFFEVTELQTKPSGGGVAVKVTFQSGVSMSFKLDPGQSVNLVMGIDAALRATGQ